MGENNNLEGIARKICEKNNLRFDHKVGQGTYKETYHIIQQDSTSLALKVYKPGACQERSYREIDAMQKCDHPGIAKIYFISTYEVDGAQYLYSLEEYLPGGTLTQYLQSHGLLSSHEAFSLGQQLISAVSHIAGLKLVHRDLKPDNILFREPNRDAVITDFGIVRDLQAESITQTWFAHGPGTYFYSPPEQLNNEKYLIDWRADQFALGILLSISVYNMHPFDLGNRNPNETILNVANRGHVSPFFRREVRKSGLLALEKMVQVWPAERYRTPDELVRAWNSQGVV
jgi:serine/threonine protein kinase